MFVAMRLERGVGLAGARGCQRQRSLRWTPPEANGGGCWPRNRSSCMLDISKTAPLDDQSVSSIRAVVNAPDRHEAERLLAKAVEKYGKTASKLAEWMEHNVPKGLTVFALKETHRRRLRTSNASTVS